MTHLTLNGLLTPIGQQLVEYVDRRLYHGGIVSTSASKFYVQCVYKLHMRPVQVLEQFPHIGRGLAEAVMEDMERRLKNVRERTESADALRADIRKFIPLTESETTNDPLTEAHTRQRYGDLQTILIQEDIDQPFGWDD